MLKTDKEYDPNNSRLDDSQIVESEAVQKGLILDFNEAGHVVGMEILDVSKRSGLINFNSLQFEVV